MSVQPAIIEGIIILLKRQDFLVVPDFGGFVLNTSRARYSDSGQLLLPPGKQLSFNIQTKQNDGVLVNYLQEKLACDNASALQHVKEFTAYCRFVLEAKRRISLEGIGFFYLDFEGNTCFEPQRDLNYLPESFGLDAIALKPLVSEGESLNKEKPLNFEDRKIEPVLQQRTGKLRVRSVYVSGLMLVLLVSILMLLVSERKVNGQLQAALGIPTERTSYVFQPYTPLQLHTGKQTAGVYVGDANGIAVIKVEEGNAVPVVVDEQKLANIESNSFGGYELVFGCFEKPANARRLIKKLAGLGMKALISKQLHKGMQVVCSKRYADKKAASLALEKIKESQPNAWVRAIE